MRRALVLVGALLLSACGSTAESPTSTDSAAAEACPEHPKWDVYVDFAQDEGQASPEAAVRAVAGPQIEVSEVRTTVRSAQVKVRLGSEEGVFSVRQVETGWLVNGGNGCATWAAYEVVAGPQLDDCPGPPPTSPQHLEEGDMLFTSCFIDVP